ncbi:unnamed protein product [Amoebophrya sp. A25]|nr:unnamed protein product [Amoebophrya sp. A25]|eukprot:GSA25T00008566001.1
MSISQSLSTSTSFIPEGFEKHVLRMTPATISRTSPAVRLRGATFLSFRTSRVNPRSRAAPSPLKLELLKHQRSFSDFPKTQLPSENKSYKKMENPNPAEIDIRGNLDAVREKIRAAASCDPQLPRLVAVSKTKPAEMLVAAYAHGQRFFGENYVQELVEKMDTLSDSCPDIQWHFIGHLQSNKAAALVKAAVALIKDPALIKDQQHQHLPLTIETVDSEKLAKMLNAAVAKAASEDAQTSENLVLSVYLQLNSSGEDSKNGITDIEELTALARYVVKECPHLRLKGLMTIGAPDYSGCRTQDFAFMKECQKKLVEELGSSLELSMGMSNDFETAIREGSDSVRVGSSIFGARAVKK